MNEERAKAAIEQTFKSSMRSMAKSIHYDNVERGWWDMGVENRNKPEMIALMHSELSEALEALRKPDLKDEHLPDEDAVGLEFADTLIRILDYCGAYQIDLGDLVVKKLEYNRTRAHKHGGKLF
jgi:NTP pyrophosphatase (non-canonical NTP hydrolase)